MIVARIDDEKIAVVLDWIVAVREGFKYDSVTVELVPLMGDPLVVWSGYVGSVSDGRPDYKARHDLVYAAAGAERERWAELLAKVPTPNLQLLT